MASLVALIWFRLEIDSVHNIIKDYTHLGNSGKIMLDTKPCQHLGNERADAAS